MSWNEFVEFMSQPIVLGSVIAFLLLLVILFVVRSMKKSRIIKKLKQYEIKYNECISVPISFKLNKATNIAKTSEDKEETISSLKFEYDDLDKRHDEIASVLEDIEDALEFNKLSIANNLMEDLMVLIDDASRITNSLDVRLDGVLEEEQEKRDEINVLKDTFRNHKTKLMGNVSQYRDAFDVLEAQTKHIESQFSQFEEWMFASDYIKAQEMILDIREEVAAYAVNLSEIPKLYDLARGEIPVLLDTVSDSYQSVKADSVFLDHLEVPKNLGILAEVLKDDLKRLSEVNVEKSADSLYNTKTRLEQLLILIEKEHSASHEVRVDMNNVFPVLDELLDNIQDLKDKAPVVQERFDFKDLVKDVSKFEARANTLNEHRQVIDNEVDAIKKPGTIVLVSMNEVKQDIEMLAKEFYDVLNSVNQANADEIRAKKQLMKLYLIINDVEVRIKKRSLPSISETYVYDLQKSRAYVRQIQDLLDQTILDVPTLNGTVSEAIDFIYKLHNNVNNLVGVVDMCENSIVYANKFRAYVSDIDSELTKAELAFNNGEYTQSLTMIINAVDRYKPNGQYEEMIKNNAQSAR